MSKYASWTHGKLPLPELLELKRRGQKLAMVTAYDFPSGRIADEAGVELVLVGDSAAMTVLGHDSTVPATMEELLMLTRAVTRGAHRPLVIADMPFGSFQVSDAVAVANAVRFVKEAGADAVKLEGAGPTLSRVQAIVGAGVPVMGHVGLTPQSATMLGGFKAQGRTAEKAERLYEDALALSLLLIWPVRLAVYGEDLFRSGGSDHGGGNEAFVGLELAFVVWSAALLVMGLRALYRH